MRVLAVTLCLGALAISCSEATPGSTADTIGTTESRPVTSVGAPADSRTTDPPAATAPTTTTTTTGTTTTIAASTASTSTTTSPASRVESRLAAAGAIRAFPGPVHYAGDVLSVQIRAGDMGTLSGPDIEARFSLDGGDPFAVTGRGFGREAVFDGVVDLAGLEGTHELRASIDGVIADELYEFEVRPAGERPDQEDTAEWRSTAGDCCTFHYLSDTAAEREIETLAASFESAADEISELTDEPIDDAIDVYFVDRMTFNGGFGGGGEVVVVVTDRDYGPTAIDPTLGSVARHELVHAVGLDEGDDGRFVFNEGLAVYYAGGHYQREPLAARAAAAADLGLIDGFGATGPIHEAAYLAGAGVSAFVDDEFGRDTLQEFVDTASGFDPGVLEAAVEVVFGVDRPTLEGRYRHWLEQQDRGEQARDLRLTIDLQEARRRYQAAFLPQPLGWFGTAQDVVLTAAPAELMRESAAPEHVAVELLMANGQQAIAAADFDTAETLVDAVEAVLSTGGFPPGVAADHLAIVDAATAEGLELVALDVDGDEATGTAIAVAPELLPFAARRDGDGWAVTTAG